MQEDLIVKLRFMLPGLITSEPHSILVILNSKDDLSVCFINLEIFWGRYAVSSVGKMERYFGVESNSGGGGNISTSELFVNVF